MNYFESLKELRKTTGSTLRKKEDAMKQYSSYLDMWITFYSRISRALDPVQIIISFPMTESNYSELIEVIADSLDSVV